MKILGLVTKEIIRDWLDNWDGVQAGSPPIDYIPGNAGHKPYDGVTNGHINKIMLEDALKHMPPVLYICLQYRWIEQRRLKEILQITGIAKSTYYRRCDAAIEFIYYSINGVAAGMNDLLEKIRENKV